MYTLINLKKIIDTLPPYEKANLEQNGAEYVNVCLEDIINLMSDYEKDEFFENSEVTKDFEKWFRGNCGSNLDCYDDYDIAEYLRDRGYTVTEW